MPGAGTSSSTQDFNKHSFETGTTASNTSGTQNTQQQQQSTSSTGPWQATQPLLSNIISMLGGQSAAPTTAQSDAVAGLQTAANTIPNYGNPAAALTSDLFASTPKYNGMLTGGLADYQKGLSPFLDPSFLNPMNTPGFSDAIGTLKNDITNDITTRFAKAGRDFSPAENTTIARGITQGIAPVIANQFNQNVAAQRGAQDAGFGAVGNTGLMLSGLDQAALANRLKGIDTATALPGVYTAPSAAQLGAANIGFGLPFQNIGMLQNLALPLSQAGSTTSSTGTATGTGATTGSTAGQYSGVGFGQGSATGTQTMSPLAMFNSLFGGGGGSSAGNAMGMLASMFA